jgi:hypothetical protein
MYTREQVIQRATRVGSKASTLRGAIRALYGTRETTMPIPPDLGAERAWRYFAPKPDRRVIGSDHGTVNTPCVVWHRKESRRRLDIRMERLAREAMDRLCLLDRPTWSALIAATSDTIARHEAARMRRMGGERRAAHLAQILDAPTEADRLLHAIYDPLALSLARSYHAHISPIYQSSRASINIGQAEQQKSWNEYSKSYKFPAVWTDAGVTVHLDAACGPIATIHTSRNKDIPLPILRGVRYDHPALLDGDLYATERHGIIIERYDAKDRKTGIAMRIPAIAGLSVAYEHGKDIAECRAEYERKLQIRRDKAIALLHDTDYRAKRKARLVARLCGRLTCTIDDARAVGYCRAGIDAFRRRYGMGETATVAELRRTRDAQALRVVSYAASRAVKTQRSA